MFFSHRSHVGWAKLWAGERPMLRTACQRTQTSARLHQRVDPSPWGRGTRGSYETRGEQPTLHPDKRRRGVCLEIPLQTAKTAPLAPLVVKNATSKPVSNKCMQESVQQNYENESRSNKTKHPQLATVGAAIYNE